MGFFNKGFKTAVLRDVFIISSTGPETLSNTRLKNVVGIGSISEVVELHSLTIFGSSLSVIHVNVLMVILLDLLMSVSPPR